MARHERSERRAAQYRLGSKAARPVTGRIVVGFDGSTASNNALAFASGWAHRNSSEVVIAYVADVGRQWAAAGFDSASVLPALEDLASDLTGQVIEGMAQATQPWSYVALNGHVASELESLAEKLHADVIVVGRSGRRSRALGRGVANRLTSRGHRIIVVVP